MVLGAKGYNEILSLISVLCQPLDLTPTFSDLRCFDVQIATPTLDFRIVFEVLRIGYFCHISVEVGDAHYII